LTTVYDLYNTHKKYGSCILSDLKDIENHLSLSVWIYRRKSFRS